MSKMNPWKLQKLLGDPERVRVPKDGTPCGVCPEGKKKPAKFIGWHFRITFKDKTGKRDNFLKKKEFMPMCRVHWLERMHTLYALCCSSERCIIRQLKKSGMEFREEDFFYLIPLMALVNDQCLRCPTCKREMVGPYNAKWSSHYVKPTEKPISKTKWFRETQSKLGKKTKTRSKLKKDSYKSLEEFMPEFPRTPP